MKTMINQQGISYFNWSKDPNDISIYTNALNDNRKMNRYRWLYRADKSHPEYFVEYRKTRL